MTCRYTIISCNDESASITGRSRRQIVWAELPETVDALLVVDLDSPTRTRQHSEPRLEIERLDRFRTCNNTSLFYLTTRELRNPTRVQDLLWSRQAATWSAGGSWRTGKSPGDARRSLDYALCDISSSDLTELDLDICSPNRSYVIASTLPFDDLNVHVVRWLSPVEPLPLISFDHAAMIDDMELGVPFATVSAFGVDNGRPSFFSVTGSRTFLSQRLSSCLSTLGEVD